MLFVIRHDIFRHAAMLIRCLPCCHVTLSLSMLLRRHAAYFTLLLPLSMPLFDIDDATPYILALATLFDVAATWRHIRHYVDAATC